VERPERLHTIHELVTRAPIYDRLNLLAPREASLEDVLLVHPESYFRGLEAAVEAGGAQLDPDTYATKDSLRVAMQALGGLLDVTTAVLEGAAQQGFAMVRPPGHHARPSNAMGFCLLANVAIAARFVQKQFGLRRILIVDFDVHHGNGTQEIFYDDPDVLYMSTHQWPLYPGTGALEETGQGAGKGATVNVPLPAQTGDASYQSVFEHILRPIALRFEPEILFVSAGYDAHWMDPLSGTHMTVAGFAGIVRELLSWADACCPNRLVALLEGGYHADALAHAVGATLQLLQDPNASIVDPFGPGPDPDANLDAYLASIAAFHKR
jgi:acetoin utilization deacetylase AcuC-like enzyme